MKLMLQRYKELQDIIAILVWDELSEEDKLRWYPVQESTAFLSQPFHVAEAFTGLNLVYWFRLKKRSVVSTWSWMVNGWYPEAAFNLVGTIDDDRER